VSIFRKDCPQCTAANAVDAVRCRCGYYFEPERLEGSAATHYAAEQDRLYRDYLAARLVQAEAELTVAREDVAADPTHTYKAAQALVAEQAVHAANAALTRQSLRTSNVPRKKMDARPKFKNAEARPIAPVKPAAVAIAPAPILVKPRTLPARVTPISVKPEKILAASPTISQRASAKTTAARLDSPAKPAAAKANVIQSPVTIAPAPVAAAPAVAKMQVERPAVAAVNPGATGRPMTATTPATEPTRVPIEPRLSRSPVPVPVSVSAKPDAVFKRLQAQKAEAIARANTPLRPLRAAPPVKIDAPAAAAPVAAKVQATQECPNCTATVPMDTERCRCGYQLSGDGARDVPAVTLDSTALAILQDGVASNGITRQR
jgi:ribosomal protein L40E